MKKLPARVAELEKRIAELERQAVKPAPQFPVCPSCGKPAFRVAESKPHPIMGEVGAKLRVYTCSECGFTEERTEVPEE